ncbi:MAG: hypothetical protein RDV48_02775 [Candidatus Eremiobacteraeota bacterium]|nr:hypothetical protein [Candidatus Eremiobacteraeota bacterium]
MKGRRIFLFFLLGALCVSVMLAAGCSSHGKVVEKYSGLKAQNLLFNRPWLDEYPSKPEQRFNVYVFSDESIGVHDKADSAYRHLLDIFAFKATPERVQFLFLHDKRKGDSAYKLERIDKGGQFNLKLTFTSDPQAGGKTYIYFSNLEWSNREKGTLPMEVRAFIDRLR